MIQPGVDLVAGPYTADGINAYFDFYFPCVNTEHLLVVRAVGGVESTLALTADYTVSLNADQHATPGGRVTLNAVPAAGVVVTVSSNRPVAQGLNLTQGGAFNAESVEGSLDNLVVLIGQVRADVDRALKLDITSGADIDTLQDALLNVGANAAAAEAAAITAVAAAAIVDGFEYVGVYTKNTPYEANNLVRGVDATSPDSEQNGSVYRVVADFTSANLATDTLSLADDITNGRVEIFVRRGASGSGSGDVQASNYLSEYAGNLPLARTNLGLNAAATRNVGTQTDRVPLNSDIYGPHTVWIPASAMMSRSSNGAAPVTLEIGTNKVMVRALAFRHDVEDQFAQVDIGTPKSWNGGALQISLVWMRPTGATAYSAVWGLQARAFGDAAGVGDPFDAAWSAAVLLTDSAASENRLYRTDWSGDINPAGTIEDNDVVKVQVYRDHDHGADTLDVPAYLLGAYVRYTEDAHNDA